MLPTWQAFLWILWRQHRWALLFILCSWLLAATLATLVPSFCYQGTAAAIFGYAIIPLASLTVYHLVIFTYGFDAGDIMGGESCFPTGSFRLPVRTSTLVLWPMAIGAVTAFLLWLATSFFILRPWVQLFWEVEMSLWWPSMMAVAILASLQALAWAPFGLPWLRLILVLILVQSMIAVPIYGKLAGVSDGWLVSFFAGLAVIAWVIGYVGVRRARHGDVPRWDWIYMLPSEFWAGSRQPFASATQAQNWYEWRINGTTLPIMTGIMLPLAFLLLIIISNFNRGIIGSSLVCTLGLPLMTASAAGWLGSRRSQRMQGLVGMMPFIASLPVTTAQMVAARLKAAAWNTLLTWAIIGVMVPMAFLLTGNAESLFGNTWRRSLDAHTILRIAAGFVVIIIFLLVWTWKRNLDSLFTSLTGIKAIEVAVAWGSIPATWLLFIFVGTIYTAPGLHYEFTLMAWPWFLGALFACRLLIAAWALRQAMRQGLLQPRTVARWTTAWLLLAAGLFSLLVFALGEPALLDLSFAVVFALPIVRLAAAPLALAWHRHR